MMWIKLRTWRVVTGVLLLAAIPFGAGVLGQVDTVERPRTPRKLIESRAPAKQLKNLPKNPAAPAGWMYVIEQRPGTTAADGAGRYQIRRVPARPLEEFPEVTKRPEGSVADATCLFGEAAPVVVAVGPYTSVQVNLNAAGNNCLNDVANEPSMAIDPTDPNKIVIGWRQFDDVTDSDAFRQAGVAYSLDAGATWTFPGVLDPGQFRSDPVLAADADGNFYYSSLPNLTTVEIFKSTDGGVTWSPPVYAFGGDKQWMTVDVTAGIGSGHIYQNWNLQFTCCVGADFTRSTNGGASFQTPLAIPDPRMKWGTLAVGPDGTLYSAGATPNSGGLNLGAVHVFARSQNAQDSEVTPIFDLVQGVNLGGVTVIGGINSGATANGIVGQVWIATDHSSGSTRGNIYVLGSVWTGGDNITDVHVIRSVDGGDNWSTPVVVNDDPASGAWHWFAAISVAPNGRIDATWYDTRSDPVDPGGIPALSEVRYSFSFDGGQTWAPSVVVSPQFDASIGFPDNQSKNGDYTHMISDNGGTSLIYAASFNGEGDVWFVRIPADCNGNAVEDDCDLDCGPPAGRCDVVGCGTKSDCNNNDIPDDCEPDQDCQPNTVRDICDIGAGTSNDCNGNKVPDDCESGIDCQPNGKPDICDIADGSSKDCNANSVPDDCDIAGGGSLDVNGDGVPDECAGSCCTATCPQCMDTTSVDCMARSGDFGGLGTTCAPATCETPNTCANSVDLPSIAFQTVPIDNGTAMSEGPPVVPCDRGEHPFGADLWYNFVAPCNGRLTAGLCGGGADFDGIMAIYGGGPACECPKDNCSLLGCGDDTCGDGGGPPIVSIQVDNGACYTIRMSGFGGATGTGNMDVSMICDGDGSFALDIAGEVEAEYIFSTAAFRNVFVIEPPANGTWAGLPSCTVGGETIENCFLDTQECIQECHIDQGRPAPTPTQGIDCTCKYNTLRTLGTFPAGTIFKTKLLSDDRRNGEGIDFRWSSNPAENDPLDAMFRHLRTFNLLPDGSGGFWRLEWEDLPGGGDQDFNDFVVLMRVKPENRPGEAVFITESAVACDGTPPVSTTPSVFYLTNVTVDPVEIPNRRLTLTQLLFNTDSNPATVAVCPRLNFDQRKDNGGFVPRDDVSHDQFTYNVGNGIPDCADSPLNDPPSVQFSIEFDAFPACIPDAYGSSTETGDIITVPAADGAGPGVIAQFFEVFLSEIDAGITNPADKLAGKPADDIKAELQASLDQLRTALLFDFQAGITNLVCPSGINTQFNDLPSCNVAQAAFVNNSISTVLVASPVTVPLPLHSPEGHTWTTDESVILDVFWFDNLDTPLAGHITLDPPVRTRFTMTPEDGRNRVGQLHLDLPDDLPDGFLGSAYVLLSHFGGGAIIANSFNFAKDATPPAIVGASTARRDDHSIMALVEATDPAAAIGDVTLLPVTDGGPDMAKLMRWRSGDFRGPTGFFAEVGPFDPDARVELSVRVRDEFNNALEMSLPIAHAGPDQLTECTPPSGAAMSLDSSLSTGESPLTLTWTGVFGTSLDRSPTLQFPPGTHEVELAVLDAQGFEGTDQVTIEVRPDPGPPVVETRDLIEIWPPDHKYRRFTLSDCVVSVMDECDGALNVDEVATIVSIQSDEPEDAKGGRDGHTDNDIVILTNSSFMVRAERRAGGNGRVYRVHFELSDAVGNRAEAECVLIVPNDQSERSIDDGAVAGYIVHKRQNVNDVGPKRALSRSRR